MVQCPNVKTFIAVKIISVLKISPNISTVTDVTETTVQILLGWVSLLRKIYRRCRLACMT